MQTKTTNLTITVLSPRGIPHYKIIKRGIAREVVDGYIAKLKFLRYKHIIDDDITKYSITIKEPDWVAAEIIIYNNGYMSAFGISEADVVIAPPQMGDAMFWDLFNDVQTEFVIRILGRWSNAELEKFYTYSDSTLTRRINTIFDMVRVKYPLGIFKNRKHFIVFGLKLGVCVEVRCKTCRQVL